MSWLSGHNLTCSCQEEDRDLHLEHVLHDRLRACEQHVTLCIVDAVQHLACSHALHVASGIAVQQWRRMHPFVESNLFRKYVRRSTRHKVTCSSALPHGVFSYYYFATLSSGSFYCRSYNVKVLTTDMTFPCIVAMSKF